jgi:hypothetical protein
MTIDPNNDITIVLGWLREISITGAILISGWKARDIFQIAIDFFKDVKDFMSETRGFMTRVETNHLCHMEAYLRKMSGYSEAEDEKVNRAFKYRDQDTL